MTTRHVVSRARVDRRETETRDATNSAVQMSMRRVPSTPRRRARREGRRLSGERRDASGCMLCTMILNHDTSTLT